MDLNMYVNGEKKGPFQLKLISDNASSILNAIQEELFTLNRNNSQNMVLEKVVVTPKQDFFDFFKSKPEPVDLVKLSTMVTPDALKKLSVEPTIDVYFTTQAGGRRRSRKSRKRKTRKNKRV
jgi:hypothetical protein